MIIIPKFTSLVADYVITFLWAFPGSESRSIAGYYRYSLPRLSTRDISHTAAAGETLCGNSYPISKNNSGPPSKNFQRSRDPAENFFKFFFTTQKFLRKISPNNFPEIFSARTKKNCAQSHHQPASKSPDPRLKPYPGITCFTELTTSRIRARHGLRFQTKPRMSPV